MTTTITPGDLADELESGRWRKATGRLARSGNRRCVIGVAYAMAEETPGVRDSLFELMPWMRGSLSQLVKANDTTRGWTRVVSILREMDPS